jgi:GTPase SAR1 family protein
MYDVTNYSSLAHIDDWLLVIRKEIKSEQGNFPIIAVGGKADLVGFREVTREEGIKVAKSRGLQGFIECSSKLGVNVEETFEGLTRIMMSLESEKWDKPYCMHCGRAVPIGVSFCYACGGKVSYQSTFTFF